MPLIDEETHALMIEKIKRRAKRENMSIEALADTANVSRGHLWRILRGGASPTVEILSKLANALDTKASRLLP